MKLNIKNPNQKLSLKAGKLNVKEGLQFEPESFNLSDFKKFEPEVVLHSDNYMYMDNYQESPYKIVNLVKSYYGLDTHCPYMDIRPSLMKNWINWSEDRKYSTK